MRCYLSGPMSGVEKHGYPAFDRAASQLCALGFEVVNPADIGRHYGINENAVPTIDTIKSLLLADLEALAYCDVIYLLPGWQDSKGAEIERLYGFYFGIPSFQSISDLLVYREGKAA